MMRALTLFMGFFAIIFSKSIGDEPTASQLLPLHFQEASDYEIAKDSQRSKMLVLQPEPVFSWTNPNSYGNQTGHIFVWTYLGRPEAIGTIFSVKEKNNPKRFTVHEFHTLSETQLFPKTPSYSEEKWEPTVGVPYLAVEVEGAPASNAAGRMRQMRGIARSIQAKTIDAGSSTRTLRLLATPLMRYEPTDGKTIEGAIFAMVSDDGTDPEVLIQIEAYKSADSKKTSLWRFAVVRFSDRDIMVTRNERILWSSLDDPSQHCKIDKQYRLLYTPRRDYMCYRVHDIDMNE